MQNEKPSYFAIIPANVRYSDIIPNAKLLFGEITALSDREGYCWASNVYFGKLYKKNQTTISEWVKILSDSGFIRIQTDGHNRKIFIMTPMLREKPKEPSGKAEGEPSGKAETSNTSKNKKNNNTAEASSAGSSPPKEKIKFTELGADILKAFETLNPACKKMYGNTTQRQACDELIATYGYERIKMVIEKTLPKTNLIKFFPHIDTPDQLWKKWNQLESAIIKARQEKMSEKPKYI
jgi:hypothetical protein